MMRSSRHIPRVLLFLLLAASAFARPAPIIPMEAVPEDMPPEVRKLVLRLYGPDHNDCIQAVNALRSLGPAAAPAAPFLAGILYDEVRHGEASGLAVDALIGIGKPSIEPVLIMFQFGGAYARMRGLKVLSALKDERGIPALITMIADDLGASGHSAFDVLRAHGQPAFDYLKEGLRSDNPVTRRNSAYAFPAFPSTNTIELLSAALSDPDLQVRTAAREAMLATMQRAPNLAFPANNAIIAALKDQDPLARRLAIRVLMRTTDDRRSERVAAMANDPDPGVQQEVIQTLSGVASTNVDPVIVGLVKSPNPAVSTAALNVLADRGSTNVIPILLELLRSPDPTIRESAVAKLGAYHSTNTVDILLAAMRDRDPLVRMRAVRAFADVRDARALDALKTAATDKDNGVRLEAVRSLSAYYLGDVEVGHNLRRHLPPTAEIPLYAPAVQEGLIAALRDRDVRVREMAFYTLTGHNAPLLPTNVLFGVLNDKETELCCRALGQLGRFRELTPLDPVRACLRAPNERVRAHAIQVLGRLRDQASFDAIVSAADGGTEEARGAAEVLGGYGEKAIPALAKALRHHDEQVRDRAAGSLAAMKHPKADEALRTAAQDGAPKTREAATHGLHRLTPSARTPEVLLKLLLQNPGEHDSQGVRGELVRMGPKALPVLLPLLNETNTAIRLTAASMLSEIRDAAVVAPLTRLLADADPVVRVCAVESLSRTCQTNAVATAIRKSVADPDPEVREASATALGQLRDKGAIPVLAAALGDASWHVRTAAAESLGRIQDASAAEALRVALADSQWPVRRAAAAGLGQLNDLKSVPALTNMLDDAHWSVRQSAAASLKAITGQSFGADVKAWQEWLKNQQPAVGPTDKSR